MGSLPPSVRLLLALIVGFILGGISSYFATIQFTKARIAQNSLEVIVNDQREVKIEDKVTNKKLFIIRKENAINKDFECSSAKLPVDRVQRLQREINSARQRSNSSMLDRAIEKARNL